MILQPTAARTPVLNAQNLEVRHENMLNSRILQVSHTALNPATPSSHSHSRKQKRPIRSIKKEPQAPLPPPNSLLIQAFPKQLQEPALKEPIAPGSSMPVQAASHEPLKPDPPEPTPPGSSTPVQAASHEPLKPDPPEPTPPENSMAVQAASHEPLKPDPQEPVPMPVDQAHAVPEQPPETNISSSSYKHDELEDEDVRATKRRLTRNSNKMPDQKFAHLKFSDVTKTKHRSRNKTTASWAPDEKDRLLKIVHDLQASPSMNQLSPTHFWKRVAVLLGNSRTDRACQSCFIKSQKSLS